ncbi:MAG: hypothetical protein IK130_11895 [Oscillospiraceae bacterium]|nr:hypothetical protein [Oscillospiraceae bacterium]
MTAEEFLEKYAVSLYVKVRPDGTETVEGTDAKAVTGLYLQLVVLQNYQILKDYLEGQTMLPRLWGSGDIHAMMFPDPDGNVICMFMKYSGDAWKLAEQAKLIMKRWLEEFEW